ncbi:MAG: hypothetical protein LBS31_10895 [Candidatus Adiutrix sp.]|nr:hypothetical protein [Candidatus Adiutrix sp.]
MGHAAIIFLVAVGLPLLLISIGFVILAMKLFKGGEAKAERSKTLETARELERTLEKLETRLNALEDVILSSTGDKSRERR